MYTKKSEAPRSKLQNTQEVHLMFEFLDAKSEVSH